MQVLFYSYMLVRLYQMREGRPICIISLDAIRSRSADISGFVKSRRGSASIQHWIALFARAGLQRRRHVQLQSEVFKGGYIGDHIGDYYRGHYGLNPKP